MKTTLLSAALLSLALGSAGCAATAGPGSEGTAPSGVDPTAFAQAEPRTATLTISTEASQALLDDITLNVVAGELTLTETETSVELSRLEIAVGDVVLNRDDNLDDTILRDMKVTLAHPTTAELQRSETGTGYTSLEVDLLVDWSLLTTDDKVVPLATQQLDGVQLSLGVYDDANGQPVADLNGGKQGTVWSWPGLTELNDLAFDLHATQR